jgi:hypothetical protein
MGGRVVTAGTDGLRVWDAESGAELLSLPSTTLASFSPDGSRVMAQAPDNLTILIYDARPANRK